MSGNWVKFEKLIICRNVDYHLFGIVQTKTTETIKKKKVKELHGDVQISGKGLKKDTGRTKTIIVYSRILWKTYVSCLDK